MSYEVQYDEQSLSDVVKFFIGGYKEPFRSSIIKHEFFVDAAKDVIIIKVTCLAAPIH